MPRPWSYFSPCFASRSLCFLMPFCPLLSIFSTFLSSQSLKAFPISCLGAAVTELNLELILFILVLMPRVFFVPLLLYSACIYSSLLFSTLWCPFTLSILLIFSFFHHHPVAGWVLIGWWCLWFVNFVVFIIPKSGGQEPYRCDWWLMSWITIGSTPSKGSMLSGLVPGCLIVWSYIRLNGGGWESKWYNLIWYHEELNGIGKQLRVYIMWQYLAIQTTHDLG